MMPKEPRLRKYFNDRNISLIIRWWSAGAVYFFIGWGTFLGSQQSTIDLVFTLGMVMGLFNILIINPLLRLMFNIGTSRPKHENTFSQRMSDHLVELLKSLLIVLVVFLMYTVINRSLIRLFDLPVDSVPLPGEPILFGLFYLLVYILLGAVTQKMRDLVTRSAANKPKSDIKSKTKR